MKRTWTIIGVRDVGRSFEWYQSLFGQPLTRPEDGKPGNGLLLFFRVDDFSMALKRARALARRLEEGPRMNPSTGTLEFALLDPDGYYVMVSALSATESGESS